MNKRKTERLGDLFKEERVQMEFGTKYKRRIESTTLGYCTDIGELVTRSKQLHSIQVEDRDLLLKVGTDAGQEYTKVTMQLIDVASNSVRHTLILAASKSPETSNNLRLVLSKLEFREVQKKYKVGLSNDVKLLQIYYGIQGGNASYPCALCVWPKSDGLTHQQYDIRTIESIQLDYERLQTQYGGDTSNSKYCHSVEAEPIIKVDPLDAVKFPTVHAHLLVNTVYSTIKERCTEDELAVFEDQRKQAGVMETAYYGNSLEGMGNLFF